MGSLLLGCALLGVGLMAPFEMDVMGRRVPSNVPFSIVVFVLAVLTLAAAVVLAVRFLGAKEGLRLIGREAGAGLWAGAIAGLLVGFVLRAVLPGALLWVGFAAACATAVYVILRLSKSGSAA